MADKEQVIVFAGTYGSLHEAELDFTTIKDLHNEKLIGKYEAAVFTKQDDGSVKVVDTDNNSRKKGAEDRLITRRESPENFQQALERQPDDIKVIVQFSDI